jgi:pimeloyl-ACP methyl ester carboxylesterase
MVGWLARFSAPDICSQEVSEPRTRQFKHDGHRLVFDDYGQGPHPVVLMPGLLLSRKMQDPLSRALAARGHRVISFDPLGHGESDRPRDMWRYSMPLFGEQVIALLDHLEIEQAVVGGTSLGANITLEAAIRAPERMKGLVVEMPVLDNGLLGCAIAFTPLLVALTFGAPITRLIGRAARMVPRGSSNLIDVGLDSISQDPGPSAALLQGIFFGRAAPPRSERSTIGTKALVIGHPRDPVHPFSDSDMLVRELPDARLVEANSILELRLTPERLTHEIGDFVDECWAPPKRRGGSNHSARRPSGSSASKRRSGHR